MIRQTLTDQLKDAMRSRDSVALDTIRYLLSQIKYVEIDKKRDLTDEEIIDVLAKEVKKREEAVSLFRSSGRDELVREEEAKLHIIRKFLPEQLSAQAIETYVTEVMSEVGGSDFGAVMRALMPKVKGKADGKLVSDIVKRKLQG